MARALIRTRIRIVVPDGGKVLLLSLATYGRLEDRAEYSICDNAGQKRAPAGQRASHSR
ncbi:hypothetical protein GCM10027161_20860 [Microbispora hainanensis]